MKTRSIQGFAAVVAVALSVPLYLGLRGEASPGSVPGLVTGGVVAPEGAQESGLTLRRVWEGVDPDFWASKPSPDGRYMTEIDWDTGDLAVIDLLSGETSHVTDKGSWNERSEWAETSVFSPDGSRIAYVYFSEERERYQIRTIGADGSGERTLVDPDFENFYALLQAWRGDRILAWVWPAAPCDQPPCPIPVDERRNPVELAWISASQGRIQTVGTFQDASRLEVGQLPAAASPDGRFVAYGLRRIEDDGAENLDLVIVSESGQEMVRMEGPADDQPVGWTPDGGTFFFQSDRELTEGLWAQGFRDGHLTGEPELLRGDLWRMTPLGLAGDALFYGIFTESPAVYVVSVDPDTGELLGDPVALEEPSAALAGTPVWSPDGRRIAYVRSERSEVKRNGRLVVASLMGGEARELELPTGLELGLLRWTEDGRVYGAAKHPETGAWSIYRADLAAGSVDYVATFGTRELAIVRPRRFGIAPDGRTGYFAAGGDEGRGPPRIIALDFESMEVREVTGALDFDPWGGVGVSPDGSTLAIVGGDPAVGSSIYLVPATGGAPRPVYRVEAPLSLPAAPGLAWTPDGTAVFLPVWGEGWRRLDLQTGRSTPVHPPESPSFVSGLAVRQLTFHPDGSRAAFVGGEPRGEIWMLKGLEGATR